jgi:hypothetical protein
MKAKNAIGLALVASSTAYFAACGGETYIATNNENVEDSGTSGGEAGEGSGGVSSGGSASGGESGEGIAGAAQGGAAGGGAACTPGEKKTLGTCEKCGTSTQTCDANGVFGPPTCEGAGVCAPGETAGCSDPCAAKTCGSDCKWGGCGLKAGATCLSEGGTNFQCCGSDHWQFCNASTCNWYSCAPCTAGSSCLSAC